MTNEQKLIKQLADAESELKDANQVLAEAKRRWVDAETEVVNLKIHRDRVKEALRVHRATTPRHDLSLKDKEIERFRKDYPEVCAEAAERDRKKSEGG